MGNYRFQIPKKSLPRIEQFVKDSYPKAFKNYFHRYLYVVDYIVKGGSYYRKDIPITRQNLIELLGVNGETATKIVKDLCTLKVIAKTAEAIPLISSAKYQLKDKSPLIYSIPVNSSSSKAVFNIISKKNNTMKNITKFETTDEAQLLANYISNITIDRTILTDVIDYPMLPFLYYRPNVGEFEEQDLIEFKEEYSNLIRIYYGDLYIKRPVLGSRVYTPFTVMDRQHRKYIKYQGKTLKCVDIANSQPLLAGAYIKTYCQENFINLPLELNEYIKSCEDGVFYEQFMVGDEKLAENRTLFKKSFFGSVFFTKVSKQKNVLRTRFIKKYPRIHEILDSIKTRYGNDGFATKMQKLEASIIWDEVNVGMLKDGYLCYNIYDSIVSHDDETLKKITKQELTKYYLIPKSSD